SRALIAVGEAQLDRALRPFPRFHRNLLVAVTRAQHPSVAKVDLRPGLDHHLVPPRDRNDSVRLPHPKLIHSQIVTAERHGSQRLGSHLFTLREISLSEALNGRKA